MKLLYIDESGNPSAYMGEPIFTMVGVSVDDSSTRALQQQYDALKKKFFPSELKISPYKILQLMRTKPEVAQRFLEKQELKRIISPVNARSNKRNVRFILEAIELCRVHTVDVIPVVIVKKEMKKSLHANWIYPLCVQRLVFSFQRYLQSRNSNGMMILDSRQNKLDDILAKDHIEYMRSNPYGQTCTRVIDIPYFTRSFLSFGIQLAHYMSFIAYAQYCSVYHGKDAGMPNYGYAQKMWTALSERIVGNPTIKPGIIEWR